MQSYTCLIPYKSLSKDQLEKILEITKQYRQKNIIIEVIFYASQKKSNILHNDKIVRIIYEKRPADALKKSIISSGSPVLLFVGLTSFINHLDRIITEYEASRHPLCLSPTKTMHIILKFAGLRVIKDAPYLVVNKQFIIPWVSKIDKPSDIITIADNNLVLALTKTAISTDRPLIRRLTRMRPYRTIIKTKFREIISSVNAYRHQRRAKRLRKNVLDAPYTTKIPVFIICRDRVEPLKKLVSWIEDEGLTEIYFIDNASTYKPLLNYLSKSKYNVIRLNTNSGHTSPWKEGVVQLYAGDSPFIVTDPDIIPSPESHGAVKLFCDLLNKYPERTKVGFGLRIDNLPDNYDLKQHVISWEKQFWVSEVEHEVYDAEIDTTFALYRPHTPYTLGPGLRTGGKFVAKHEPWYIDSKNIPDEVRYYREHADKVIGSWGTTLADVTDDYSRHYSKREEN